MDHRFRTLAVAFVGLAFLGAAVSADAGPARRTTRKRQVHQQERIRQGVRSGELTKQEARELEKEQKAIVEAKKDARSDGVVTQEEKKEIRDMQNEASENIRTEKHDAEKQPRAQ